MPTVEVIHETLIVVLYCDVWLCLTWGRPDRHEPPSLVLHKHFGVAANLRQENATNESESENW